MKILEDKQEGFRTTLGSNHLESFLHSGVYRDNPELKRFGMLLMDEDDQLGFYRTDNGIAIDLKAQGKHLIFGTANYGDPISTLTWRCVARALATELGGSFMTGIYEPSHAQEQHAEPLIETFFSHLHRFELA
ncbi:MAG: hypothetical protein Q9M30_01070 [Mariprofundaceae bacterium]|nr:hypothetical protein [Mariprofundaceae bacterium]